MFSVEITIERIGRREKYFKTNVLVPKTNNKRKEEGATVGVCRPFYPTFPQRAASLQAGPAAFSWKSPNHRETPINYPKCPTFVKRETPAIFSHLIDSPKQMKQMNKMQNESEKAD